MKNFLGKVGAAAKATSARILSFAKAHKIWSGIIVLAIVGIGYWSITALAQGNGTTQYSLTPTAQGELDVTITDSGEVSAEHQLSLSPKASGEVTSVNVVAGQQVKAGTVVATLDSSDADDSVTTARENLESAQISYQQALTSSSNTVTSDQSTLRSSLTTISNALTTSFTDLPTVTNNLNTILYSLSTLSGYTVENTIDAYANYINTTEARTYHDKVANEYQTAQNDYQTAQNAYSSYDITTATPDQALSVEAATMTALQSENQVLRDTLSYYNYINSQILLGGHTAPSALTSQISSLTGYINTISGDITTLQSARTSLITAQQSLSNDTQSLNGSSISLSVQSAQLNLQKAQEALAQAEKTESDYVVTAPFDGTIASVSVKKYDQASSGTAAAVLITKENYVTLSVNEADASQIAVGQKASITFDAIDNLTIDGTVAEVDQVGTVSQGVATYTVKVGFDSQDSRIKPGMTAEATITTNSVADAIQIPSAAVHTTGNQSYVEVATPISANTPSTTGRQFPGTGSTTPRFRIGSTTPGTMRTTSTNRTITLSADQVKITRVPVTVGISNDTMTQITTGLMRGQLIVTQTATNKSGSAQSSGSIFNLFGGTRRTTTGTTGAAGATRSFGGGAAVGGARLYGG